MEPSSGSAAGVELPQDQVNALARFERVLVGMRRSPDTVRLYSASVRRWFEAGGLPGHLDSALAARWLATLRQRCAVSTVNLHIKALRAFYRVQAESGAAPESDWLRLPRLRKPPTRVVRFLTADQVGEVLGSLPLDTFAGVRDYALILTLFATGMRAGEIARMELGDLLDSGLIYVRGKAGRDRYVPLGPELRDVLDGYLKARATTRPGKRAALWVTRRGQPLANGRSVWEIVHRRIWVALGRRGGWHDVQRVGRAWRGHYPHELRASCATALLRSGCPIPAIAELLGHSSLESTARYLGVDLELLRAAASKHPRARRAFSHAPPACADSSEENRAACSGLRAADTTAAD